MPLKHTWRLKGGRSEVGCCFFPSCSDGIEFTEKMQFPSQTDSSSPGLIRGMGLGSATALNMIDMIGVGPFITMPLVLSAMGGPQAMLGWIVGALLAVCDGLVAAELGAAFPGSGGSYRSLSGVYGPRKCERVVSVLFICLV